MTAKHEKHPSASDTGWPPAGTRHDGRDGAAAVDTWLALVARGDQEAFASVYDHVAGTVYTLVRRMVVDPARSEEMTGDVLAEVWRTASLFSSSAGSGMSWIMAIARRRAIDHVRAVRSAVGGRDSWRPHLSLVAKEVAEQAGMSPRGEPVAGWLALPEPQRQALLLTYYGGYSQAQVADFLGVRPGTVSAWIRDGLARLRGRAEW